jgi:membrane carboxypeptidase/penicillin-binding protein PbpC
MRHIGSANMGNFPNKPGIIFPPHLSQVEIAKGSPLAIEVEHGRPPLTLMINGAPVTLDSWSRSLEWFPEGRGSFDLLVIDARGAPLKI